MILQRLILLSFSCFVGAFSLIAMKVGKRIGSEEQTGKNQVKAKE